MDSEILEHLEPFVRAAQADAPAFAPDSLALFRDAARKLKAAEEVLLVARQAYGEAVKRLSEEAVK